MSKFSNDVIELFKEFKKETGKYQELDLKEIEFEEKKFDDVLKTESIFPISDKEILSNGEYPVVSPERDTLISGYSNDSSKLVTSSPVITFGDHNCSVKYVDFSFIPCGNLKVLKIKNGLDNKFYLKFIYYHTVYNANLIRTDNYQRHYYLLRNKPIFIPKPLGNYTSYDIQKAIDEFIEYVSFKSGNVIRLMEDIMKGAEKGKENLICKLFVNLPNKDVIGDKNIIGDVIKLFKEFKKETGKYQELDLERIEFKNIYIFEEIEDKLIPTSSLNLKHDEIKELENKYRGNQHKFYPVFSASSNPIGYLPEEFKPDKIILSNPENPDISFATDGDASAGTNFIIHTGKYYINNTRKVIKFNENDKSFYTKYLYFALHNMKEKYNFNRDHKATSENLKTVIIPIPKPLGNYTSYDIQKAIADFIEFSFENYLQFIEEIKKESDLIEKVLIKKFFEGLKENNQ